MRAATFLKNIAAVVLVAFVGNTTLAGATPAVKTLNPKVLKQQAQLILTVLEMSQRELTRQASAAAFREPVAADKTQSEYLRNELEALVDQLPADLGSKAVSNLVAVEEFRTKVWMLFFSSLLALTTVAYGHLHVSRSIESLNFLLSGRDLRTGVKDPVFTPVVGNNQIVQFSEDPEYLDSYFNYNEQLRHLGPEFKESVRENLIPKDQIEHAKKDGISIETSQEMQATVLKYLRALSSKRETLIYKEQILSPLRNFLALAGLLGFGVIVHGERRIQRSRLELKAYQFDEDLYEKNLWSIVRQSHPDVPKGHQAAVAWLDKKIKGFLVRLFQNVGIVAPAPVVVESDAKDCLGPTSDPNWEAERDAQSAAETDQANRTAGVLRGGS